MSSEAGKASPMVQLDYLVIQAKDFLRALEGLVADVKHVEGVVMKGVADANAELEQAKAAVTEKLAEHKRVEDSIESLKGQLQVIRHDIERERKMLAGLIDAVKREKVA